MNEIIEEFVSKFIVSDNNEIILPFEFNSKERKIVYEYLEKNGLYYNSIEIFGSENKQIKISKTEFEEITNKDIEIFAKYSGLPIPFYNTKFIEYHLEQLELFYDAFKKWELFLENRKNITKEINNIIENVKKHIEKDIEKVNDYKCKKIEKIKNNIYTINNADKSFLSIDIKSANYTVLKGLCDNYDDWKTFISKFTDNQFLIQSKFLRELIFGKCNFTKKATNIQENILDEIEKMIDYEYLELVYKCGDEIIYEIKEPIRIYYDLTKLQNKLIDYKFHNVSNIFRLSIFTLYNFDTMKYYAKEISYNSDWYSLKDDTYEYLEYYNDENNLSKSKVEFKCVPKKFIIQVIKKYLNISIDDYDLYFMDENILAKYQYTIFNN